VVAEVVSRQLGCWSEASFAELTEKIRLSVGLIYERHQTPPEKQT
jgi:hypothetical protein